jgi:hypothetical protein
VFGILGSIVHHAGGRCSVGFHPHLAISMRMPLVDGKWHSAGLSYFTLYLSMSLGAFFATGALLLLPMGTSVRE